MNSVSNVSSQERLSMLQISDDDSLDSESDLYSENKKSYDYNCTICLEEFELLVDYQRHFIKHIVNKPFQCPKCEETFFKKSSLKKHLDHHEIRESQIREETITIIGESEIREETSATIREFPCELCKEIFPSKSLLHTHMGDHYVPKFSCNACFEHFPKEILLRRHERRHTTLLPESVGYTCMLCDAIFPSCYELVKHMDEHEMIMPYPCRKCDKTFFYSYILKNHEQSHNFSFACNVCGETFLDTIRLHEHEKTHLSINLDSNGVISYSCDICSFKFPFLKELESHYDEHQEENPFPCLMCSKTFMFSYVLSKHKRTHKEMHNIPCEQCQKKFRTKGALARHLKEVHAPKVYHCGPCNKSFSCKRILLTHNINAHANLKTFACSFCPAKFATNFNLLRHYTRHMKEKELHCELCDMHFSRWDGLNNHNKYVHMQMERPAKKTRKAGSPGKKVWCHLCNRMFSSQTVLVRHQTIKHHIKPVYSCFVCGKTFKYRFYLQTHERKHTGDKPYKCVVCKKNFIQESHMQRHLKDQHPDYDRNFPFKCAFCNESYRKFRFLEKHHQKHHSDFEFIEG